MSNSKNLSMLKDFVFDKSAFRAYFIIADSWVTEGSALAGPYTLTVTLD